MAGVLFIPSHAYVSPVYSISRLSTEIQAAEQQVIFQVVFKKAALKARHTQPSCQPAISPYTPIADTHKSLAMKLIKYHIYDTDTKYKSCVMDDYITPLNGSDLS